MKPSEALELIALMRDSYPSAKVGVDTVKAYARMIVDLDHAEAQAAVYSLIAESKFFPAISEIRRRVVGDRLALQPAEEAWADVLAAIGSCGIYRTPQFEHHLTSYALASIGWQNLCNSGQDQLPFLRSQFMKAYKAGEERMIQSGSTKPLLEHHEHRRLRGLHDEPECDRGTSVDFFALVEGLTKEDE